MFLVFGLISLCLSYLISALVKGMFLIIGFLCGTLESLGVTREPVENDS